LAALAILDDLIPLLVKHGLTRYYPGRGKDWMLLLAHLGLTLGAAVLVNGALTGVPRLSPEAAPARSAEGGPARQRPPRRITAWFASLGERVDIRLLLIGSLLPDIIDKPLGQWLLRDAISNGRIFCHTLLFLIVLTLSGLYCYLSRRRTGLLALSFGTFAHLVFDQMWLSPRTLFWPLYGVTFERLDLTNWVQRILSELPNTPSVYTPEIIGGMILVLFMWVLLVDRKLRTFITRGRL
jgi:inner membrane protein